MKNKKIFNLLLAFLISVLSIGQIGVYGQELGDLDALLDGILNSIGNGGYLPTDRITVSEITNTKIVVQSPVVQDGDGNKIRNYEAIYSNMPVDQIDDPQFTYNKKTVNITDADVSAGRFFVELNTTSESLDTSRIYYLNIIPKDSGPNTRDVCFKLNERLYGEDNYCVQNESNASHSSAGANLELANVAMVYNSSTKTIQITWIAVEGSSSITVYDLTETDETWKNVGTVSMSAEQYSYSVSVNGEHTVRLVPNNGGTEYVQTVVVQGVSDSTITPGVPKVPVVGPKENIILISFLTLAGYFVYRFFRRAKN